MDYKIAEALVWLEGLWYTLVRDKLNWKILNVIRKKNSNIRSCVMLNQQISDTFVCDIGVRQGENLSLLFLVLHVNDIESKLLEYNYNSKNYGRDMIKSYLKLLVLMDANDRIILCDIEEGTKKALIA